MNNLSRRDFLKLSGLSLAGLAFSPGIELAPKIVKPNPPPEELPGGIDLSLTDGQIRSIRDQWETEKNHQRFNNFYDFSIHFCSALNFTRAENMSPNNFTTFLSKVLEYTSFSDNTRINNVDDLLPTITEVATTREACLKGEVGTAYYSYKVAVLMHAVMASRFYGMHNPIAEYGSGDDWNAFTPLSPQSFVNRNPNYRFDTIEPPDVKKYYDPISLDDFNRTIYDLNYPKPKRGLIQKSLLTLTDLAPGDIIFRDRHKTRYFMGHPLIVTEVLPPNTPVAYIPTIFDSNVGGQMLASCAFYNDVPHLAEFSGADPNNLGILRTEYANNVQPIVIQNRIRMRKHSDLPVELESGQPNMIPDFSEITEISRLWTYYKDPKMRPLALREIIMLHGLTIKNLYGMPETSQRWQNGDYYWKCNIYLDSILRAFGIKAISHWIIDNKPNFKNFGSEYPVSDLFTWVNTYGRQNNIINTTDMPLADRQKMLKQGYIFISITSDHSCTIVPGKNSEGETMGVLTQAGYDLMYHSIDRVNKFDDPLLWSKLGNFPNSGTLFAILLPGVNEPRQPQRQLLFARTLNQGGNSEKDNSLGIVNNPKQLKAFFGDLADPWYALETKEVLKTEGSLFAYAYEVVSIIQSYKLPLSIAPEQDGEYFKNYLITKLEQRGYSKILKSQYGQSVIQMIAANFETPEKYHQNGGYSKYNRLAQPIQCLGLSMLLESANGKIKKAPAHSGGLGNPDAQQIAINLLDRPGQISFVDKYTSAIHLSDDRPSSVYDFQEGDSIFLKYGAQSTGHVATVVSRPLHCRDGHMRIAIADSNRIVLKNPDGSIKIIADGMPRLRLMTIEDIELQYLTDQTGSRSGRMILLRPN